MAFCNSCGASLPDSAKFCDKCGTAVNPGTVAVSSTIPSAGTTPAAPAPRQGNTAKTLLIVAAVIGGLLVLGIATSVLIGLKIASRTHVRQEGDKVKIESPFGTVETNQDAAEIAKNLGVDIYPGARALEKNSATVAIGGMHTVAAQFETDDPVNKVADFYKKKFPNANVTEGGSDHYSIVQTDKQGVITISIAPGGSGTQINIANVQRGSRESQ